MSLGGLLGYALLGGVQGGATAAQQVAKRREEFDLKKELLDIEDAKARARLEMQNAFQVKRDGAQHGYRMDELAQSNEYQTGRDNARFAHEKALTKGKAPEIHWRKTTDEQGMEIEMPYVMGANGLVPVPMGGAGNNPLIQAVQSGQFQLRDPGETQAATGGGASDPTPQPSNAQQPPPAAGEFSPTASLGLLQRSPDDWQQQNASYNKVKPAVQNVKLALERGMSPSKEDFERARPHLSEKEIQEVERQLAEDAQYR